MEALIQQEFSADELELKKQMLLFFRPLYGRQAQRLLDEFADGKLNEVAEALTLGGPHPLISSKEVTQEVPGTQDVGDKHREKPDTGHPATNDQIPRTAEPVTESLPEKPVRLVVQGKEKQRLLDADRSAPHQPGTPTKPRLQEREEQQGSLKIADLDPACVKELEAADARLDPVIVEDIDVRSLSFDLSRVLFNPGVYQLRDPRSRVYNFDPYLEKIMPVTEFNFDALNEYITSSDDGKLRGLALQNNQRYTGSSSSMTSTIAQFHFLISAFREINLDSLSRGFKPDSTNFTRLTRAPSAVFLRWRDGVYALDADKEFDSANILMSLGRSLEKLLTLEKDDFEKYRKSARGGANLEAEKPEQYHYGRIGKFLMRSQLDAYDSRLPGSGMFDLKTRAVAAVRMSLDDHEPAQGYQIKERFGQWESYEREYYDMIRSAFLKYSLQVRMGRMDGIFVAFHNIERMFGFQYISLPEMDMALHGQTDPTLGDREFGFSVKILEDVFDRATARFPGQTLRFHFETREATAKLEPVPYMNIFAEPMSEEDVDEIQRASKEEMAAYEQRIFNGLDPKGDKAMGDQPSTNTDLTEEESQLWEPATDGSETASSHQQPEGAQEGVAKQSEGSTKVTGATSSIQTSDANVDFLESLSELEFSSANEGTPSSGPSEGHDDSSKPLMAFKVMVRSSVNGKPVGRPANLGASDDWKLEYTIEELPAVRAASKYRLCKSRRAAALKLAMQERDGRDYFRERLLRMSQAGEKWRQQQDELDAQREQIVLYGLDGQGQRQVPNGSNVQQQIQE
ncbi:uncharacterized protein HMPREF1541_04661 [Cyphellophora europaea CBS 101466]|uniref:Pet127-domain-containing protein n=1 Tax=Cyphellophora europaea (strain CBS 101466) TaxID=1220924 RepID=W2RXJ8_CYPE1|nr:uncharacterized protein HMPREF1541_04661 [Cyphellophora europaea CBS 101466]ETN40384.1 hypothetical protein HMPREF1541_04661 [Cyphellophora europaea CBS 101466]